MHVLVLEDAPTRPNSLTQQLRRAGVSVTPASDEASTLAALRQRSYRAIMCDPRLALGEAGVFDRLRRQRPEAARLVIFAARADLDPALRQAIAATGRPAVADPLDVPSVQVRIEQLTDESPHRRVLVIEDDPANRSAIARAVRQAGFEVHAVENGIAGYTELERRTYGAIVCDVRMPYLGGKSFFEQIEEKYPNLAGRVVFVTAWAHEPETRRFLEQTGQPFIPKPYDLTRLQDTVAAIAARPF